MAQAFSAYDYITQNNRKTWLLVLLFPVSLLFLIFLAAGLACFYSPEIWSTGISFLPKMWRPIQEKPTILPAVLGFTWAFIVPIFIIAIGWMLVSLLWGDKMMLTFAAARPPTGRREEKLKRALENVAIMAGLPCPRFYVIEDASLNAFATGYSPKHASIAVTTGLVDKLTDLELEGVIAHEMAHIGNRDMRLNMLVITGLGIFGFVGRILLRTRITAKGNSKGKTGGIVILFVAVSVALIVFNYLIAPLLQLALSRTREYAADATGAKIIHNPAALADALEKIANDARVETLDGKENMAVACIASPFSKTSSLTSTHPPIEERINRLRKMG